MATASQHRAKRRQFSAPLVNPQARRALPPVIGITYHSLTKLVNMGMPAHTSKKEFLIREKNLPSLIKEFPHWLIWRYERAENDKPGAKPRKMPYYPEGGKRYGDLGSERDVRKLRDFHTALAAAKDRGFDGIGLAILPEQDITVLDLDDCIDDSGVYSDFANELIEHGSYIERSPSGRGLRAVYSGALLIDEKRNFHIANGERVEVYCGKAYTTFTGNKLPSVKIDEVLPLPRGIRRTLVKGMGDRVSPGEGNAPSEGSDGDGVLMSMNAARIPNMSAAQCLRVLNGLPDRWGNEGEGTWFQVAGALHLQFNGSEEGYEVLDAWSKNRGGYDAENNRARWDAGFSHERGKQTVLSMRNLVFEARDAGVKFKQSTLESWGLARAAEERAAEDEIELPSDALSAAVAAAWQPVDISGWGSAERPAGARPLVRNWLYEGSVALFSSHGGGGKSYVMLTFCALAATGGVWFGQPMEAGGCLFVNGEDPIAEVQHRLWGICNAYGIAMADLAGQLDIVDVTSVLHKALYTAGTDFGKTEFTKQYAKLKTLVESGKYRYLVLDNLSKFYMANENARPMVDEFISALAAIAAAHGVGVVLVGHDSKLAAAGQGYSGSTAWHNSARARWALTVKDGNRDLVVEKNNYGAAGHGGRWAWDDTHKVIRMQDAIGEGSAASEFHDQAILEGVRDAVLSLYMGGSSTAVNKRGRLGPITEHPWVMEQGLTPAMLREALERCVEVGLLGTETYKNKTHGGRENTRYCPLESDLI